MSMMDTGALMVSACVEEPTRPDCSELVLTVGQAGAAAPIACRAQTITLAVMGAGSTAVAGSAME